MVSIICTVLSIWEILMDAVIKQMDVTKKYEMYAAENPELATLLDQYKELTK